MNDPAQRIHRLLIEVREARQAIVAARPFDGAKIKHCACGRITLDPPCQVCRHEKALTSPKPRG